MIKTSVFLRYQLAVEIHGWQRRAEVYVFSRRG